MASTYFAKRHDIGVTDVGSAGAGTDLIGMMLARKQDDTPAYEEYDGKFLADQFFTGRADPANINPEEELLLVGDDWRSGFGLEYFDYNNTKRYFASYGADLRHKNRAVLSYGATAATLPGTITTAASLANTDFETTGSWTNGSQSATPVHAGTGSWQVSSTTAYQAATTWDVSWRSKTFTFSCWAYAAGANQARIQIDDGVGVSSSSYVTGDSTFRFLTVTRTLDASATKLQCNLHANGAIVYFDDAQIGSPVVGIIRTGIAFNDAHYIAYGQILAKQNAGGTGFDAVCSFPAAITDLEVMTISSTDYLFIALGVSNNYWYMTTAEAITSTLNAVTNNTYQFFVVIYTTALTMYGNDSNSTIRSTVNPLNGGTAWSTPATQVDNDYYDILELFTKSGALYIRKEDKPFYLNSSGAVQEDLAPECVPLATSTQDRAVTFWNDEIFYAVGASSLLRIGTANSWINPSDYCNNLTDFVGRVFACAGDDKYLYIVVDNSTKVEILAGRDETVDDTTSWVWHPVQEITLTGCEIAWVSSIYQKRLWIASDTSGESLYYIPLPLSYGNIESDTNRSFATGGNFETPMLHGNFKNTDKAWIKLTLTMGHTFNAGRYWTAKYKKLGDTSWTTIGNYTGSATSMTQSRYIDTTNKPFSAMMKFQFTGVTDDTTITPILHSYEVKAIMYPSIRRIIHCVVKCAEDVVCKNGLIDKNMYDTIKTALDNARNNAVWPVSIRDIDGSTVNVKFLPVSQDTARMLPVKMEKNREQERYYHLLMMEVELS